MFDYRNMQGYVGKRLGYLRVITNIVKSRAPIPKNALHQALVDYTQNECDSIADYPRQTGLIRNASAAGTYLKFAEKLHIIAATGNAYQPAKYATLLQSFCTGEWIPALTLTPGEHLFLAHQLFSKDADTLLTLIQYIHENAGKPVQASKLKKRFQTVLLDRIRIKMKGTSGSFAQHKMLDAKNKIVDGKINADYIVATRLEWLLDLGIVNNDKTSFTLSDGIGTWIANKLPQVCIDTHKDNVMDINGMWLSMYAFDTLADPLSKDFTEQVFPALRLNYRSLEGYKQQEIRRRLCDTILPRIFMLFSGSVPKVRFETAAMYFCVYAATEMNIVLDLHDVREIVKMSVVVNGFRYDVRLSARSNESYIVRQQVQQGDL